MRKLSGAAVAMIMGVALYFTLAWGYDGAARAHVAELRPGRCLAFAIHLWHRQPLRT